MSKKMFNPLVSIIILSHNRKTELKFTLRRIISQNYKNIEIIVVDNGSSDGAPKMVNSEYPGIRLIELEKNIGIAGWNKGIEIAKGEYLLILDDDSFPELNSISKALEYFFANPEISIIAAKVINNRTGIVETEHFDEIPKFFNGCGVFIRNEVIKTVGLFNDLIFIYFHELDYSARCRSNKIKIRYNSNIIIRHNQSLIREYWKSKDPSNSSFRFYHYFISYSIILLQRFQVRYVLIYLPKWVLNRLLVAAKYSYYSEFTKALLYIISNLRLIINKRAILNNTTQKFYNNGNIPQFYEVFDFRIPPKKSLIIYIKNFLAFILFSCLRILFKKNRYGNNYLFINSGQIGDLVISSIIFQNEVNFKDDREIYFLMKKKYTNVYHDYSGKINIIPWDNFKYKYNFLYRIKFLNYLNKLRLSTCINLTVARGILTDELSILSGAENVYCFRSNGKYFKKMFAVKIDKFYSRVFDFANVTVYEKQRKLLKVLFNFNNNLPSHFYLNKNTTQYVRKKFKSIYGFPLPNDYIALSPLTDKKIKNWKFENYSIIIKFLTEVLNQKVILLGTRKQKKFLDKLKVVSTNKIINSAGKFNINESTVLVKYSNLFIGNDSGFTHIANALGVPFIGIIGGGAWNIFFPCDNDGKKVFLYSKLNCFGCDWHCKYNSAFCLEGITTEMVKNEITKVLKFKK